ncbi:hypothetical protein D3C84_969100 [compost metagenome]
MPSSPNSLTITAMRRPWALSSMCRSKVVLPEPRKPVTMVTGSLASVFIGCPLALVAGIRDENRQRRRAREEFATGSPRPVVVRICVEAGLLADGVPIVRLAFAAPSREPDGSGFAVAWQRTSPFTVAGAAAALTAFPS